MTIHRISMQNKNHIYPHSTFIRKKRLLTMCTPSQISKYETVSLCINQYQW